MKTEKSSKSRGKKLRVPARETSAGLRFKSNAVAENAAAKLRQNREALESEPPEGEGDARASLI